MGLGQALVGSLQLKKSVEALGLAGFFSGVPIDPITGKVHPHDIIEIPVLSDAGIIETVAHLYKLGHSIPEISKMLKVPRSTVRYKLKKGHVSLRPSTRVQATWMERNSGKTRWNSPYGFKFHQGKIVIHPQEHVVLKIILSKADEGFGFGAIASYLNDNSFRPRRAQKWDRFTVRQIAKWHERHPEVLSLVKEPTE